MAAEAAVSGGAAPERLPPADLRAERAVIGSVLHHPAVLEQAVTVVSAQDFYKPAHAELFDEMLAMRDQGRPVDAIALANRLGERLHRLGGASYLIDCMSSVPTPANVAYYAEIVADKAARRRLIEATVRISQLAYALPGDSDDDLAERAREILDGVAGGGRSSRQRRLRRTPASAVTMRRLRWLWSNRIVLGGLTLLAGREGLGKSTVAVDLAAQVTRGELAGEFLGEPRHVIYVNSEDARDSTIVPRLVAAGADLDRVVFLDAISPTDDESPLVLPHDTRLLAEEIEELGVALVVLDAATSVIDSALDGDRDRQMRRGLEPISKLAADTGVAVVGIVHFGKRESADTGKLILGSIAWSQVARSVLAVARDEDTHQLVISSTKANLAPGDAPSLAVGLVPAAVETPDGITQVARVEWHGETTQRAEELLAVSPEGEDRSLIAEAVTWLLGYLADEKRAGSAGAGEILRAAKADGFNERLLQRARKRAQVSTHRTATGWTWTLDPPRRQGDNPTRT
ncbi:AAA family ATPase [Pseudonocardia sp. WMMC193]|uniref:AAA family ATPase n=1 Tax=Pseudonocardia sp. WMMC193 TaxID=2911965 RepID=UPI001F33F847|nr:AAA family ATPase [Pseudonocardia sp. WMMC193]MCF7552224.1 AAA family ATPase [Pseudonocardia sp. WMMC193]